MAWTRMQNRPRFTALTDAAGLLAPTFELSAPAPGQITITITPAEDTTATRYRVRYSKINGNFTDPLDYATICIAGTTTLRELDYGSEYWFSVSPENDVASGQFSAAQSQETNGEYLDVSSPNGLEHLVVVP
jgi:hypothetical protein